MPALVSVIVAISLFAGGCSALRDFTLPGARKGATTQSQRESAARNVSGDSASIRKTGSSSSESKDSGPNVDGGNIGDQSEREIELTSFQEEKSDPSRPGFEGSAEDRNRQIGDGNPESGVPTVAGQNVSSQDLPTQQNPDRKSSQTGNPRNAQNPLPRDSLRSISENPLTFEELMLSVQVAFPPLLAAAEQQNIALGELTSAWGAFDTLLKGDSIAAPLGFYENYRQTVSVMQPVFQNGGYLYGGYKLGRGDIQPWFKERQTNEGGEFAIGGGLPLLKNRAIDERRAAIAMAQISVQLADPFVRQQLNLFVRDASIAYWGWIAAGLQLQVQQELLDLAESRAEQIEARVREEDLPRIALIDNSRFITARKVKLNFAEQKLRTSAIKLSLFLRDIDGNLVIPGMDRLPNFPDVIRPLVDQLSNDYAIANMNRPELTEVDLMIQQQEIQRQLGRNSLLPKLDVIALASQDVGGDSSSPDDKGPLELEAGLMAELPLQRRMGRGKIASSSAKIQQLTQKRIFLEDKIQTELQTALATMEIEARQYALALQNLRLAREALSIGQVAFDEGDIDLIVLNIYEQSVTDAELDVISAEAEFFAAASDYRLALGVPIDQPLEILSGDGMQVDTGNEQGMNPNGGN